MAKQTIQQKGGKALLAKRGKDYFRSLGKRGGRAFVKKHGSVRNFIKTKQSAS